jgi:hypothetical protein
VLAVLTKPKAFTVLPLLLNTKSYVVFGKANGSIINLSTIADVNNSTGGFVINGI